MYGTAHLWLPTFDDNTIVLPAATIYNNELLKLVTIIRLDSSEMPKTGSRRKVMYYIWYRSGSAGSGRKQKKIAHNSRRKWRIFDSSYANAEPSFIFFLLFWQWETRRFVACFLSFVDFRWWSSVLHRWMVIEETNRSFYHFVHHRNSAAIIPTLQTTYVRVFFCEFVPYLLPLCTVPLFSFFGLFERPFSFILFPAVFFLHHVFLPFNGWTKIIIGSGEGKHRPKTVANFNGLCRTEPFF